MNKSTGLTRECETLIVLTAHLQTRFSAVQVGYEVLPVLSGSVDFCPNRLYSVFRRHDRNQIAARDHSVKLGLTLISVTEELLSERRENVAQYMEIKKKS